MTYEYIVYKDIYYVPRAPSLCEARERDEFFKKHFEVEPMIVGPFEWEILSTKMEVSSVDTNEF
jgi:hypothetical protein